MAEINFLKGSQADYESATKDDNIFYYTTDQKNLYLGKTLLNGGGASGEVKRVNVVISEDSSTIQIPSTLAIDNENNLIVYVNGILLIPELHYTYNKLSNALVLNGYSVKQGDIVTFIQNINDIAADAFTVSASEIVVDDMDGRFPGANSVENALIQLYDKGVKNITVNGQVAPKANGVISLNNIVKTTETATMNAKLIAQNNAEYMEKQVRNIYILPVDSELPEGQSGDICILYKE